MKKVFIFVLALVSLMMLTNCADNRTANEILSDVNKLVSEKKYEEAVEDLELIKDKFPEDSLVVISIYKLAEINGKYLNNYEAAAVNYSKVAEEFPASKNASQSRFMAGYLYANKVNDLEKAKAEYEKFIQEYPNSALKSSVEFELRNLGVPIEEIGELKNIIENKDSKEVVKK